MSVAAKRNARIEITSSAAGVDRGLNDARRKMRQFERDNARASKQAERDSRASRKRMLGGARNVAGGVAGGAMMGLGMDAMGGLQGMATDVLDYEKSLTRLQITADKSPEVMRDFSASVMKASSATGLNRSDILGAASAYVALTGDMTTAQQSTATWAKIAQATGTPIQDIASTAAAISQQMGIQSGDMENVFSGLAAQGKAGAVELKDLAGLMAQIAPQWAQFGNGKGARGVAELGSALQVVKRGFGGDAAETVTGLQSLLTSLVKNAGRFEDGGIKIFDVKNGKKSMRDVFSIVESIGKSKLVNDPEALEKAFGRVEAYRAFIQLKQNKDMLGKLVETSKDGTLIQRDFDTYMQSSSGRLEQSWTKIKNAIGAALTPERVDGFANSIEGLVEKFEPLLATISKIAGVIGSFHGAGQAIRGAFGAGDGKQSVSNQDWLIEQSGGAVGAGGHTDDENVKRQRLAGARSRIADAGSWNKAVDDIMAGEINEKSSPESIKRAFAQKYNTLAAGQGNAGAASAGSTYLKRAGVSDPAEVARKTMADVSATAAQLKTIAQVRDAIKEGFASAGIKIGAEPIEKAAAGSIKHRRGH